LNRIAIDYTPAYEQGGGIGRYVRDLVAALARQDTYTAYRLFVAGAARRDLPPAPAANFSWRPTRLTPAWLARIWHRARVALPVESFTGAVDLFHATDFVLPPTRKHTRTIVTVHDLSFIRVPDTATPGLRAYLNVVVPRSVRVADHILADSQATKGDLIALYNVPPEKVTVLLSGVDPRFFPSGHLLMTTRSKYHIPAKPYLFTVGTVQPRKNYVRLIQALAFARGQGYDVDLVIAGGKGWLDDPIYAAIDASGLGGHVHLIGFADDVDLPSLYSGAEIVVFPSLYEGFGFPVLEGMASGVPVITSNVSSLPEVAGEAALLVDPYRVDEIAAAICQLLDDSSLRDVLIRRGFDQARRFTWERSAAHLQQIYANVLDS
jgi:glycosyltransferase involved in cell wall biosynthesis